MRFGIVIVLAAAGCAQAGKDNGITGGRPDGGGIHFLDSDQPRIDADLTDAAPQPDAPPGQQTMVLTQTPGETMTSNNSIACGAASPDIGTVANTYYRVFDLSSFGISTDFNVSTVSFQVEDCESGTDGAAVAVRVGTYTGTVGSTLQTNKITVLASNNNVHVPEVIELQTGSPGGTVDAPISATIPGGSKMIVEVDAPDGTDLYQFYIGSSSSGGQTGLGYMSSPVCANPGTTPKDIDTVNPPSQIDILLTVTGTY